jgi:phosphoglycerate dehydrogenase-like enzyme
MSTFRVGVSPDIVRPDGKLTFPSYSLEAVSFRDDVEVVDLARTGELTPEHVADLDAVVLMLERVTPATFHTNGRLKLVARMGVGYDTIDVPACTERDVALTITPDAVRRPMASTIVAFVLALAHNLFPKDRITRTGALGWPARLDYHGLGLAGRVMGSVGVGNIGADMFRLLAPFGMRMIACDPYRDVKDVADLGVELVDLDTVFRQSDFLAFNCPLTEETRQIGGRDGIAKMKPTSFLINTSRGPVVDQKALYDALVEGRLAGAALDVFDPEPPPADEPILKLENVICAPHSLGWTDEMFRSMGEINAGAIAAVADGRDPENVVNQQVLGRAGWRAKLSG